MKTVLLFSMLILFKPIYAHEGHNKTPGTLSAPHGGQIKGTNDLYLEIVTEQDKIKIYPMSHDMKPLSMSQIQVEASIQFPKKSQHEKIKLESAESFFSTQINSKGSHRYTLDLAILFKGKKDKLSFNIEAQ